MPIRVAFCTVVALMLFGPPVSAQPVSPGSSCTGQPGIDWDVQIEVCTAIIETPEQPARNRAVAYKNRGNAWDAKGHGDRAIDDYSEAIRLDPDFGIAYSNRGRVWMNVLELDRAIADFDEAIRINPDDEEAYFGRGLAWLAKGDKERALADLQMAEKLGHWEASDELAKLGVK
jgi:tetratricopeptide (TPR) repeat protein